MSMIDALPLIWILLMWIYILRLNRHFDLFHKHLCGLEHTVYGCLTARIVLLERKVLEYKPTKKQPPDDEDWDTCC